MDPWETLGVSRDVAVADLRRRYAALIKEFRPETHPQDFARIRAAYEVVLPFARRREQEAFEEVAELAIDVASDASMASPPDAALSIEDEIATGHAAITVVLASDAYDASSQEDDEPGLAVHFRRFHVLAESAVGMLDASLLPELHALLQARTRATLDDSQALEFALMRWFIEAGTPPLTLLFETGRAFDWHRHPARMSPWLSAWTLRRMETRLQLSRDLVYARRFTGNAWLRRLHSPRRARSLLASRAAVLEALRWAERWQHASDDADAPHLASALNPHTLRRIRGRELLTTDVLTGVVVAWAARDLVDALLCAVVATAAVLALRLLGQWLRPAPGRYRLPAPIARFIGEHRGVMLLGMATLAALGAALALPEAAGTASLVAGTVLVAPVLLILLRFLWDGISWLERCGAALFAWRGAVDRLEFDHFISRPFASTHAIEARWSQVTRWKAIPAALRFETVEIATRARPARPMLFRRLATLRQKPSLGRKLWFGAWIVFAIARAVHAFYGK